MDAISSSAPARALINLPPEMLDHMFQNVQKAQDLQRLTLIHPRFNSVLESRKKLFGFDLALPFLAGNFTDQELLTCRLVCKQWKNSVDKVAEETCCQSLFNEGAPGPNTARLFEKPEELTTVRKLENLAQRWTEHPACGVIGASFQVGYDMPLEEEDDDEREIPEEYWNRVRPFLKEYGSRITSLTLYDLDSELDCKTTFYLFLQSILCHCPSLKALHVKDGEVETGPESTISDFVLDSFPLPNLPRLEVLVIANEVWKGVKLALLQKYGGQLKKLQFEITETLPNRLLEGLTNLEALRIQILGDTQLQSLNGLFGKLESIPARHIEISFLIQLQRMAALSVHSLLNLCEVLRATSFAVQAPCPHSIMVWLTGSETTPRKRICCLKHLTFVDVRGVLSYNWLESFPSLETVDLHGYYFVSRTAFYGIQRRVPTLKGVNQQVEEKLKVREFLYSDNPVSMYESNIWYVLPRLRRLQLNWYAMYLRQPGRVNFHVNSLEKRTFTREEYEDLLKEVLMD